MGLFSRLPAGAKAIKPRLYQLVDAATNEHLSAPNHALTMDVVATVCGAVDPKYAATKACKRLALRLRMRTQRVQVLALHAAEACVRGCGQPFHDALAKSDLLPELGRMGDRSVWSATGIQIQVLAMLQDWAYNLPQPEFSALYSRLKARGLPFPPRDGGAAAAAALQPYPGLGPPPPGGQYPANGPPPPRHGRHHHGRQAPQGAPQGHPLSRPPSRGGANLGAELLAPGRTPAELAADLEVARTTVSLLNEVLDGAEAERRWGAAQEEYCGEVAAACAAVTTRLAVLLGSGVTDEGVVAAALDVNEQAQAALDRRSDMMEVAAGRRAPPPERAAPAAVEPPGAEGAGVVVGAVPAAAALAPPPLAPSGPFTDLLDLDWPPPEEAAAPAAGAPPAFDPFHAPREPPAPPSNNPFAPKPASPGRPPDTAAPAPAPSASNAAGAFMSDDAFAAASAAPEAPAADAGPASGNPFAAAAAAPEARAFKRPAPLEIPSSDAGPVAAHFVATPSPFGAPPAPAYPTPQPQLPPQAAAPAGAAYPQIYGASAAPAQAQPALHNPFALQQAPTPSASTYHPQGPATSRPFTDAFGDLVSLTPKREEPPPPPKGAPMRRGGGGGSSAGDVSSVSSTPRAAASGSTNGHPPPSPPPAAAPAAKSWAAAQPVQAPQDAGLAAFDAFDSLASSR